MGWDECACRGREQVADMCVGQEGGRRGVEQGERKSEKKKMKRKGIGLFSGVCLLLNVHVHGMTWHGMLHTLICIAYGVFEHYIVTSLS